MGYSRENGEKGHFWPFLPIFGDFGDFGSPGTAGRAREVLTPRSGVAGVAPWGRAGPLPAGETMGWSDLWGRAPVGL